MQQDKLELENGMQVGSYPDASKCPPGAHNTYIPTRFATSFISPDDESFDKEFVNLALKLIRQLCPMYTDTVLNFIATTVQRPAEKLPMLWLCGRGDGGTFIAYVLRGILGERLVSKGGGYDLHPDVLCKSMHSHGAHVIDFSDWFVQGGRCFGTGKPETEARQRVVQEIIDSDARADGTQLVHKWIATCRSVTDIPSELSSLSIIVDTGSPPFIGEIQDNLSSSPSPSCENKWASLAGFFHKRALK